MNQRRLRHPHIIHLKEVFLTEAHLVRWARHARCAALRCAARARLHGPAPSPAGARARCLCAAACCATEEQSRRESPARPAQVLVMEYAGGGDLFRYVSQRHGLPEPEARWFFIQVMFAVRRRRAPARPPACPLPVRLLPARLLAPWPSGLEGKPGRQLRPLLVRTNGCSWAVLHPYGAGRPAHLAGVSSGGRAASTFPPGTGFPPALVRRWTTGALLQAAGGKGPAPSQAPLRAACRCSLPAPAPHGYHGRMCPRCAALLRQKHAQRWHGGGSAVPRRAAPRRLCPRALSPHLLFAPLCCPGSHRMGVANRDLKLENTLLMDTSPRPLVKLADFG